MCSLREREREDKASLFDFRFKSRVVSMYSNCVRESTLARLLTFAGSSASEETLARVPPQAVAFSPPFLPSEPSNSKFPSRLSLDLHERQIFPFPISCATIARSSRRPTRPGL